MYGQDRYYALGLTHDVVRPFPSPSRRGETVSVSVYPAAVEEEDIPAWEKDRLQPRE